MKKIVIIGGGAGGAGTGVKLRRLDETSKISIYEMSSHASYSNCGLPYYFSNQITPFNALILNTVEALKANFNLDVFVQHKVIGVDSNKKTVEVKNLKTGDIFIDNYDELIISNGAKAIIPKIKGIDKANNIFTLKTPDDVKRIDDFIKAESEPKDVVIIGGGFIGLEVAENIVKRGIKNVTIIDAADQLFATCDKDFAAFGHRLLIENNIKLMLNSNVVEFKNLGKEIVLANNKTIKADLIFLTVGIEVETEMFEKIGIKIGSTKGIIVDEKQRTNIKNIYAVGDIAESFDLDKKPVRIPLATAASRQAVVAANTIYGIEDTYKGSEGTNAITLFNKSMASIGKTEKQLKAEGIKFQKIVSVKPEKLGLLGGTLVFLKILFNDSGKIFGAQAFGPIGAEKRISYLAIMMYAKQTVYDMVEYQFAYNPLVDTSFDAVNIAGRIARLQISGQVKNVLCEEMEQHIKDGWIVIDVRNPIELETAGKFPNAINIPLGKLRESLDKLDKNGKYITYCRIGMRSYNAALTLQHHGFKNAKNLLGGHEIWLTYKDYGNL